MEQESIKSFPELLPCVSLTKPGAFKAVLEYSVGRVVQCSPSRAQALAPVQTDVSRPNQSEILFPPLVSVSGEFEVWSPVLLDEKETTNPWKKNLRFFFFFFERKVTFNVVD